MSPTVLAVVIINGLACVNWDGQTQECVQQNPYLVAGNTTYGFAFIANVVTDWLGRNGEKKGW